MSRRRPGTPQKGLPAGFVDEKLINGLVRPTALRFLPDGRVLVAEQRGMLKLYPAADRDEPRVLLDLRSEVLQRSQIGLLGLAVDPDFPSQPYIYLAYSRDAPLGGADPNLRRQPGGSRRVPAGPGMSGRRRGWFAIASMRRRATCWATRRCSSMTGA